MLTQLEPGIHAEAYWEFKSLTWTLMFFKDLDKRQRGQAYDAVMGIVSQEDLPDEILVPITNGYAGSTESLLQWAWIQARQRGAMDEFGYGRRPGEVVKVIDILGEVKI